MMVPDVDSILWKIWSLSVLALFLVLILAASRSPPRPKG